MWRKPCRSASRTTTWWWRREGGHGEGRTKAAPVRIDSALAHSPASPFSGVTARACPIGAKISACPGRCAAWSIKGVYARLRGLGGMMRCRHRDRRDIVPRSALGSAVHRFAVARAAPASGTRYTHCLRDGPGSAVHRLRYRSRCTASGTRQTVILVALPSIALARRFGRHGNANLVEIRIIPTCIRLWLQRLSRPRLATSACRGRWPNDRGGRGKSGEGSCYFPVINRPRCVEDLQAGRNLGRGPRLFLAARNLESSPSVPIPKFANPRGTSDANFGIKGTLADYGF